MMSVIDMPFGLEELDKVFEVSELLDNKEELLKEFQPEISKFLVKKDFFTGKYKRAYQNAFDDLVVSLIRRQIIKHYPSYNPQEIILLTDKSFLKLITNDYYFNTENYLPKDGNL